MRRAIPPKMNPIRPIPHKGRRGWPRDVIALAQKLYNESPRPSFRQMSDDIGHELGAAAKQGKAILQQPLIIAMLAVPILIQVYLNSGLAYLLNRRLRVAHSVAGPSALIGASNFFELAVAAAITLFGFESGAALATVVGVLVEVPVMLSVVAIVNRTRPWYEAGAA